MLCLVPSQFILQSRDVTFDVIGQDLRVLFSAIILMSLIAQLGLSLGLIFKSSPGAISALLIWPTILEGMVFGLLSLAFKDSNVIRFAPIQGNGFQLVSPFFNPGQNTWLTSLVYFSGFVSVFIALGSTLFSRRDA